MLGWSIALEDSGLALMRFVYDLRGEGRIPDSEKLHYQLQMMLRGYRRELPRSESVYPPAPTFGPEPAK